MTVPNDDDDALMTREEKLERALLRERVRSARLGQQLAQATTRAADAVLRDAEKEASAYETWLATVTAQRRDEATAAASHKRAGEAVAQPATSA